MGIYRSSDKELLKPFKSYLKTNVEESVAIDVWSTYNKYIYIDDLHEYLRLKTKQDINVGVGNYNSKVVIVLPRMDDTVPIKFLKELFKNINIDMNRIYITSYYKGDNIDDKDCEETLTKELTKINPDMVFQIGQYRDNYDITKTTIIDRFNFDEMLKLYNQDDLTDNQKKELMNKKKVFWNKFKFIIKYYKG